MRLPRQTGQAPPDPAAATVRSNRRTSVVLSRLEPGDIAVIHQIDLDAATARELLRRRPSAVVNTAPFISGRVANLGPGLLLERGVQLVEAPDLDPASLTDGAQLRLDDGTLYDGEQPVARGSVLTAEDVARRLEDARSGLSAHLDSFASNVAEHLRRDQDVFLHGRGLPEVGSRLRGRPTVVVGADATAAELKRLRPYLREERPALVAVDGGVDEVVRRRLRPDVVVVAEESLVGLREGRAVVRPKGLKRAREVVVHTRRAGESPAAKRLASLGVEPARFTGSVNTFDVGMLLAHHAGATLVVPVGSRAGLDDLVEGSAADQASTFLTRMRVGPRVVDGSAVAQLYSGRMRWWYVLLVLLAGLVAVAVAIGATPVGQDWWDQLRTHLSSLTSKG
ncbi:MAG TPA: putative cytokinetic ring protein SteA [Marmoricola sp.]|nr:putative cytokinetic ring protein SteA [Marmoricola sp.]